MRRKRFFLTCLTALAALSCSQAISELSSDVEGEAVISLSAEKWVRPVVRSGQNEVELNNDVPLSDFKVEIFRTDSPDGEVRLYRDSYSNTQGQAIGLNGGQYRMRAWYGNPDAVGFTSYCYEANATFSITAQQRRVEVSAVASMANVAVAVEYGKRILSDYPDAFVKVCTSTGKSLQFTQDETRTGYLPAGMLHVEVYATVDGELKYFSSDPVEYLAKDFVTFRVETAPSYGDVNLNITVDRDAELIEHEALLPPYTLPQNAPEMTFNGFDNGNSLEVIEAVPVPESMKVDIVAGAMISHCYLDIESEYLMAQGLSSSRIDLLNVSEADAQILRANGFRWMRSMAGRRLAYVDLTGVAQKLCAEHYNASNPFSAAITLTVEDEAGNSTVSDTYTIFNSAPEFSFEVESTDAWARRITGMEILYGKGNPSALKLQYRPSAGGEWTDAVLSSDSGSTLAYATISALTPSTEYQLRAIYNGDEASAINTVLTTEAAAQVANSGFEEWTDAIFTPDVLWASDPDVAWYLPWSDEAAAVWAVNSKVSMLASITTAYLNYKCHPTVSYLRAGAYEGTTFAQIATIAVGSTASEISYGTAYYGELFIGTATDSGQYSTTGTSFPSRPDKVSFYYKFAPQGSETYYFHIELRDADGNVIATAHTDAGASASSWTRYEADLTYSTLQTKASSIFISFRSTTSSSPETSKKTIEEIGGSYTVHGGSILSVDALELIYE